MTSWIALDAADHVEAELPVKAWRLKAVGFEHDLPAISRSRFRFDGAHQPRALALFAQEQGLDCGTADYAVRPRADRMSGELERAIRRSRKRNCDSMTDSSSCARSNPARPLLGIACAVIVDSALRRRYPVSCALQVGNGRYTAEAPAACVSCAATSPPS